MQLLLRYKQHQMASDSIDLILGAQSQKIVH